MTGSLNAKESQINSKFKPKLIIKIGGLMLSLLEVVGITLKRSIFLFMLSFPKSRIILEKLNDDLTKTLETISKSERMINTNMSEIGEQYKSQSE